MLEKARQASEKAYSGSMGILTSLEWALGHLEPSSEKGADVVDVMNKAWRINRMLTEVSQDITKLTQRKEK